MEYRFTIYDYTNTHIYIVHKYKWIHKEKELKEVNKGVIKSSLMRIIKN